MTNKSKNSCCGDDPVPRGHGPAPFFGRLLMSLIFILAGVGAILDFQGYVATLAHTGIPGVKAFAIFAILFKLVGGILLLLGLFTRFAIYLLMIFLLPTTLIFCAFWRYNGPEMALHLSNFLKNLAIYGGLLALLSYGPGRWSLDACCCRK